MSRFWSVLLVLGLLGALFMGRPAAAWNPAQDADPGALGPRVVARDEYNLGEAALMLAGLSGPSEVIGSVHYPADLEGGPFPLIVLLHGTHAFCYEGDVVLLEAEWPCGGSRQPIWSYRGYDYLGELLASHGYVAISISANGIIAQEHLTPDGGMAARSQLVQHHLMLWRQFATTGAPPFGSRFVGKVDLDRIGTMGHSRGGEGVVRHYLDNLAEGEPFGIRAVFALASVNFNRLVASGVPLASLMAYCDGDVADQQGVRFYDDARYRQPGDPAPKYTILVMGANHNYYNTQWTPGLGPPGAVDDWLSAHHILELAFDHPPDIDPATDPFCGTGPDNQRLTPAQQRATALAYVGGFMRLYVGGETAFAPLFVGAAAAPPSARTSELHVSYHAPDEPTQRRDVNRLRSPTDLEINTLGGAVRQHGLTPYDLCGGEEPLPARCLPVHPEDQEPHNGRSGLAPDRRGPGQLRIGWLDRSATFDNDLPAEMRDISHYTALQFRVAVNFADCRNPVGEPQDFSVILIDGTGRTAAVSAAAFSGALYYPPSVLEPQVILNMVRIPLARFSGLDLSDVRTIRFAFDRRDSGGLLINDLAFTAGPVAEAAAVPSPTATATVTAPSSLTACAQ